MYYSSAGATVNQTAQFNNNFNTLETVNVNPINQSANNNALLQSLGTAFQINLPDHN